MGCSLLRQGMDNLIVSLEGPEARAFDEKAERENLSRDAILKVCDKIFPHDSLHSNLGVHLFVLQDSESMYLVGSHF
jgi:hypothetical protein